MENGTIEREITIDAAPEVVFDVISSPEHIRGWWNGAQTDLEPRTGSVGTIRWDGGADHDHLEQITVVDARPFTLFSFRWVYDAGPVAAADNSLLVVFELPPEGGRTLLRMTATGFEWRWPTAPLTQSQQTTPLTHQLRKSERFKMHLRECSVSKPRSPWDSPNCSRRTRCRFTNSSLRCRGIPHESLRCMTKGDRWRQGSLRTSP